MFLDATPFWYQNENGTYTGDKMNLTIFDAECDIIMYKEKQFDDEDYSDPIIIHHYFKGGPLINATRYFNMTFYDGKDKDVFRNISNVNFLKSG